LSSTETIKAIRDFERKALEILEGAEAKAQEEYNRADVEKIKREVAEKAQKKREAYLKEAASNIEKKVSKVKEEADAQIKTLKQKATKNRDKAVNRIAEEVLGRRKP